MVVAGAADVDAHVKVPEGAKGEVRTSLTVSLVSKRYMRGVAEMKFRFREANGEIINAYVYQEEQG